MAHRTTAEQRGGPTAHRLPRAALVLCLLLAACGSVENRGDGEGAEIVVTIGIWADVVERLLCENQAQVDLIVDPGGDPHVVEASLADRETMTGAELVVANGGGLEAGLVGTLEAVAAEGVETVEMIDLTGALPADESASDHDHDHEEDAGSADHEDDGEAVDPHVWFDPTRVRGALPALATRLEAAAGLEAGALDACVAAYSTELESLDDEVTERVATLEPSRRRLVTNHDSLGYFADRYGFEVIGTVIPSTSSLAETNPAALAELRQAMDAAGVSVVFSESGESGNEAAALAAESGIEVVPLTVDDLGPPGSETSTYVDLVRTASLRITDALA